MSMLTINGRRFVKTVRDYTADCTGFYRVNKGGTVLMDSHREPVAFLVDNPNNSCRFFVTAFRFNERTWYMFSTTQRTEQFLGLASLSYSQQIELAETAARDVRAMANAAREGNQP